MSQRRFLGPSRSLALVTLLAASLGLGAFWQRSGAVGDEPRKVIDRAAINHAEALSEAFHNAAEMAMPSVVTVHSKMKAKQMANSGRPRSQRDRSDKDSDKGKGENPFKGTPLEEFFGNNGGNMEDFFRQMPQMPRREGVGSGVIIDRSGIVLTNNHVVAGADEVTIKLPDGREFKGEDIKTDEQTDLAVVRIKGAGSLPSAAMGNSDALRIGDWVIAIGNPFEQEQSVSAGIISGMGRELGSGIRGRFLQTDAAINPGNSGGPLVNLHGEVVGINTAIATNSGSFNGIGFAIPINSAKWVIDQLINQGSVQRAYLGVGIGDITPALATKLGARPGEGVLVSEVHPNTPAATAGFKDGDVITRFAGTKVKNRIELQELVERTPLKTKQPVEILRDGRTQTLYVMAEPMPKEFGEGRGRTRPSREPADDSTDYTDKNLGLTVANMTTKRAEELGFTNFTGVLVTAVDNEKAAAENGIREGMLIMKVGKTPVKSVEEFQAALKNEKLGEGIMFHVRDNLGNHFMVVKE